MPIGEKHITSAKYRGIGTPMGGLHINGFGRAFGFKTKQRRIDGEFVRRWAQRKIAAQ